MDIYDSIEELAIGCDDKCDREAGHNMQIGNLAQEVINIMELACDYGDFTGCLEVTKSYKQMLEYRELQAEINNTPYLKFKIFS
ncbi:hypothetical protein [Helicobacter sp. MIT 99-5507]|uniref:hypothetical protein n=1 Tax=Helicobacter sp. MIT 99-5507 TaxID=152489 RepID=UPI000E1EC36C|nr:hypothetical protein [Helicobacter sp. MIT 99-5507]RDU57927.1 hypothetical protein CQA42_03250 [Helicobacter sp. MIT 99-5507]